MLVWRPRPILLTLALAGCSPRPSTPSSSPTQAQAPMSEPAQDTQAPLPRPENTILRSELQRATGGWRPGYLLAQLGPEPHRPQGRFQGWKITKVFPGDPKLCAPGCDLLPGDVILSVNGASLERPEQLSQTLEKLKTAESLDVRMIRAGELREARYSIVETFDTAGDLPAG